MQCYKIRWHWVELFSTPSGKFVFTRCEVTITTSGTLKFIQRWSKMEVNLLLINNKWGYLTLLVNEERSIRCIWLMYVFNRFMKPLLTLLPHITVYFVQYACFIANKKNAIKIIVDNKTNINKTPVQHRKSNSLVSASVLTSLVAFHWHAA